MATLKSIVINFFFMVCMDAGGQTRPKGNAVDSIKSEEEAFRFLKMHFPKYKGNNSFENYRNETRQIADSLKVRNWVTTDIDNNGETDLLIFRADKLPTIFAMLSSNNKFLLLSANYNYCKYQFIYPVIASLNRENVILLYSQNQIDYDRNTKHFIYTELICDTLTVKRNLFVDYLSSPKHYEIEKIQTENDGMCEGRCPRINISIDAKGYTSKCTKEMFWDNNPKFFTAQLPKVKIKELISLLQYSNFTDLNKEYEVGCTDQPTSKTTITYDNGKTKIIYDYGSSGNFTLTEIYKIAYGIKWTEKKRR